MQYRKTAVNVRGVCVNKKGTVKTGNDTGYGPCDRSADKSAEHDSDGPEIYNAAGSFYIPISTADGHYAKQSCENQ